MGVYKFPGYNYNLILMLKNLLNINNAKVLSKISKKNITGDRTPQINCQETSVCPTGFCCDGNFS